MLQLPRPCGWWRSEGGELQGGGGAANRLVRDEGDLDFSWPDQIYSHCFFSDYTTTAAPLTDYTAIQTPIRVAASERLKSTLCTVPILRTPDFSRQINLQTNASEHGLEGVLSQIGITVVTNPLPTSVESSLPERRCIQPSKRNIYLAIKLTVYALYPVSPLYYPDRPPISTVAQHYERK